MRTAVASTSIDTYHSFAATDLQRKEGEVLAVFLAAPGIGLTREQLAERLGWKESAVCGRANSLVTKRVLEEVEGGRTKSGRAAKILRLPTYGGQGKLF